MAQAARRTRMTRADRREHFLDVAAELVLEKGVEAVTMEGVAAAAGVSKGLGYAYFDNAGELLVALMQRELSEYEERGAAAMASATDFEGRLRGAVRAWFDMVAERGQLLGTLLQASQVQQALQPHRQENNRRLEEFFGRMAERELGIPRKRAVAAAAILMAGLNGVLERWVTYGDSRKLLEETFVGLAMNGVRGLGEDGA
jgi:AcrR family transcriptional regulator